MTRTVKILLVLGLTVFGVWGCSKGSTGSTADKSSHNEVKVAKLEDELKLTAAARDTFRTKLAAIEEQLRAETARGVALQNERDVGLANLKAKSLERDQVQTQFDSFRKNIKELLGQTEAVQVTNVSMKTVSLTK